MKTAGLNQLFGSQQAMDRGAKRARVASASAPEIHDEGAMQRAILARFEVEAQQREWSARREQSAERTRDRRDTLARLELLDAELEAASSARSVARVQRLQERERARLERLTREDDAARELEALEARGQEEEAVRDTRVATGVATPFGGDGPAAVDADIPRAVMRRRGTWRDDRDDEVYEARLRAWRTGQDVLQDADEGEDGEGEGADSEPELCLDDDDGVELDADALLAPAAELDVEWAFDEELRVVCEQCLRTPGLEQLLQVTAKSWHEMQALLDAPLLLRDCRYNVQRALALLLDKGEEAVARQYPPRAACEHAQPPRPAKVGHGCDLFLRAAAGSPPSAACPCGRGQERRAAGPGGTRRGGRAA